MAKIVDLIKNKKLDEAKAALEEGIQKKIPQKLTEMRKRVSAETLFTEDKELAKKRGIKF